MQETDGGNDGEGDRTILKNVGENRSELQDGGGIRSRGAKRKTNTMTTALCFKLQEEGNLKSGMIWRYGDG